MIHPALIEVKKFFMDAGMAGSLASRFVEMIEKESMPVSPIIRKKLVQKIMKPLLQLELQGGKWTHQPLENQAAAEYEYHLNKKEESAHVVKRKRWK